MWLGISNPRDAQGNPVTGVSMIGETGIDWTTPAPEPSVALLLGLGLALLGGAVWFAR